jgi:hypothetical protein
MAKVKYNRKEYREEYLNSPEWKAIRDLVFFEPLECQCCKNTLATDLHHMVYRDIVDIKISDLLPVCRSCHDFIHQAITDGYISTKPEKLKTIERLTRNITNDQNYKKYHEWLNAKHPLPSKIIGGICSCKSYVLRLVCGVLKTNVWYDTLNTVQTTGRNIEKIQKIINTARYRKKNKLDKHYKRNVSLKNIRNKPLNL